MRSWEGRNVKRLTIAIHSYLRALEHYEQYLPKARSVGWSDLNDLAVRVTSPIQWDSVLHVLKEAAWHRGAGEMGLRNGGIVSWVFDADRELRRLKAKTRDAGRFLAQALKWRPRGEQYGQILKLAATVSDLTEAEYLVWGAVRGNPFELMPSPIDGANIATKREDWRRFLANLKAIDNPGAELRGSCIDAAVQPTR